ncbi:histone-lysine N-methyltransferase SETMAR [Trichonephila clavipes]|nr:histone-lysine N-methyltransferase SETMAR [Trichonephila clavipes]
MDSQIPEDIHIRHCMLLESHKGSNGTFATKNICDVYPSVLDVRRKWKQIRARQSRNCQKLLTNIGRPSKNICNRLVKANRAGVWVQHNLSEENKANRSTTCNLLLQRYNTEPFFGRLISADEKRFLYDNPKRKRQWLSPKEPSRRTAKPGLHPKKALCVCVGVFVELSILKCLNLKKL